MMRKGIAYGVGVGPGDPELMTLKAARLIRENEFIAVPGKKVRETAAFRIAVQAVPELEGKTLLDIEMPMTRDAEKLVIAHKEGAARIESILDSGKNIVFLTLGDPTVYSTFGYLARILASDGYPVEYVSGVPSFCAAAARLGEPLAEWDERVTILPAAHAEDPELKAPGTKVIMKSASRLPDVKRALVGSRKAVSAVENCGMPNERVYSSAGEIPDDAGYFLLLIARDGSGEN